MTNELLIMIERYTIFKNGNFMAVGLTLQDMHCSMKTFYNVFPDGLDHPI